MKVFELTSWKNYIQPGHIYTEVFILANSLEQAKTLLIESLTVILNTDKDLDNRSKMSDNGKRMTNKECWIELRELVKTSTIEHWKILDTPQIIVFNNGDY